jgi:addiction module HigA family antidote
MIPKNRIPTHPGEILREEFLLPLEIPQRVLAEHIGMQETQLSTIINGRAGVSAATALKLGQALNTSPEFWMNLQSAYDLAKARQELRPIHPLRRAS